MQVFHPLRCRVLARPLILSRSLTTQPKPKPPITELIKADIADAQTRGILQAPPAGSGPLKSLIHTSMELLKFYFRGGREIFRRQRSLVETPATRREWRMLRTQKMDVLKVVPFLITAMLLEELIPVMVLYAPAMLPSTCILPGQLRRIRDKKVQKAREALLMLRAAHEYLEVSKEGPFPFRKEDLDDEEVDMDSLVKEAKTRAQFWTDGDRRRAVYTLYGLSCVGIQLWPWVRVGWHMDFLQSDDAWLAKEGVQALTDDEVRQAVVERGLGFVQQTEARKLLQWWLGEVGDSDKNARLRASVAFAALYK
ncbi:hypothetical protein EDD18DRAFT_1172458 [Armillaria luteobubalina]|uniref:Letm1 RBD domain-containing protein n=1 Tax=Armillaria luteobubalina TaxID=153913 RepID=A0AA39UVM6_9AGAR|nr:hypothetical protein EDD18DRAFT_1172458 [Armillaria luteobubalina]